MTYSHILKFTRKNTDIYLITGIYLKQNIWHYLEVPKNKIILFEKDIDQNIIDISNYGKILASGWGKSPPSSVIQSLENNFSYHFNLEVK